MDRFSAYPSLWRRMLLAAIAAGFVAIGLWMVGVFGPVPVTSRFPYIETLVAGWLCLAVFSVFFVLWLPKLFETAEQLRIDHSGIRYAVWSDRTIPWAEISAVATWTLNRQKFIVLHLRDPAQFPGKGLAGILSTVNRKLTGGEISITLTGTDRTYDEAMSAIAYFRPRT